MIARKTRISVAAAALCMGALLSACGGSSTPTAYSLQILHISDADGSDAVALNSVANLSGLIAKYRDQYPTNTLVVSSGDNYTPGPRFNAADARNPVDMRTVLGREGVARADIAFLNELGVQASALGNHELDLGTATFASAIAANGAWPGAQFPYLSYNVNFAADAQTSGLVVTNGTAHTAARGKVSGWTSVQVGDQMIGVIGASSTTFPQITSTGDLTFSPAQVNGDDNVDALAAVIQAGVFEMIAAGMDKIVLLAHMQKISTEKALAARLRGVDVIVAGGSNTLLADSNDVLRAGDSAAGTYPYITTAADGKTTLVVNVDADYKYLGRIMVPFDDQGNVIANNLNATLNGPIATSMTDDSAGAVTPDAEVQVIRNALQSIINEKDGEYYGYSDVFLEGRRAFVRTQESNAGNIAADAQLWYAQQVDSTVQISLKNGGGIRAEIGQILAPAGSTDPNAVELLPTAANTDANRPAGTISRLMLETSYKYNNALWVFDISAERLLAILNHGVNDVENIGGRFPQVAGFSFSFDPSRPQGSRVRSLKVGNDVVAQDGVLQGDGSRTFRMVTMNFLATGGDGYNFAPDGSTATEASLPNLLKLNDQAQVAAVDQVHTRVTTLATGTEQDSMAEYLAAFHSTAQTAYQAADTSAANDLRVQNLSVRVDTVLQP